MIHFMLHCRVQTHVVQDINVRITIMLNNFNICVPYLEIFNILTYLTLSAGAETSLDFGIKRFWS